MAVEVNANQQSLCFTLTTSIPILSLCLSFITSFQELEACARAMHAGSSIYPGLTSSTGLSSGKAGGTLEESDPRPLDTVALLTDLTETVRDEVGPDGSL